MIGQTNLRDRIAEQIKADKLAHFILLVGERGSGRKTLAKYIGETMMQSTFVTYGISVDDVRAAIEESKKLEGVRCVYLFPDADTMSVNAKNALLKVLEEPPKGAYFIMTLEDENNTLNTILSRATIYHMEEYSTLEMKEYMLINHNTTNPLLTQICGNLGEIDLLADIIDEFYEYTLKVVNNIDKVSGSNSFKIGAKINLDNTEDKYDLLLFWRCFTKICFDNIQNSKKYSEGIITTAKYMATLRVNGINKQMAFDNWLLEIRERWFDYADDN